MVIEKAAQIEAARRPAYWRQLGWDVNAQEEIQEEGVCLPAPPGVKADRADSAIARPSLAEGSADVDPEEVDLDVFPDGYDHRRDIYSGDREASLDPLSAYHLATHTHTT